MKRMTAYMTAALISAGMMSAPAFAASGCAAATTPCTDRTAGRLPKDQSALVSSSISYFLSVLVSSSVSSSLSVFYITDYRDCGIHSVDDSNLLLEIRVVINTFLIPYLYLAR